MHTPPSLHVELKKFSSVNQNIKEYPPPPTLIKYAITLSTLLLACVADRLNPWYQQYRNGNLFIHSILTQMVTDIWKLYWYQCSKETSPGRLSTGHRWNVGRRPLGSSSEESTCPSCAWHPRIHPGHSSPIRTICNYLEWSMFQSRQW